MDLNADVGEGGGTDVELLAIVTSASIACGAHAGDLSTMRATVQLASENAVAIGAHPGYPDPENFGRRDIPASPRQISEWILEQVGALMDVCADAGARVRYVKAHGALYNRAARDAEAAAAVAAAVRASGSELVLLAPPDSAMLLAAGRLGLATAREAFLDRAYHSDGSLLDRAQPDALIHDAAQAVRRAVALARHESIEDAHGNSLFVRADSLCVHGDSPHALAMARAARKALEAEGVAVGPFA